VEFKKLATHLFELSPLLYRHLEGAFVCDSDNNDDDDDGDDDGYDGYDHNSNTHPTITGPL
jgi:hypothetical protein